MGQRLQRGEDKQHLLLGSLCLCFFFFDPIEPAYDSTGDGYARADRADVGLLNRSPRRRAGSSA